MNKITKLLIMCLTAVSATSCNSWLEVEQDDNVMENDLFDDQDGFQMALNGVYLNMNSSSGYGSSLSMTTVDVMAQYYDCSASDHTYGLLQEYAYDQTNVESTFSSIWQSAYQQIANLNAIIEHCDEDGGALHEGYYELFKGEALGLRAMYHFDMLRLFGPLWSNRSAASIPYVTSSDRTIQPLLSADSVMECVMADLEEAANLLREVDPVITEGPRNESGGTEGNDMYYRLYRMNYFAVQTLRARAALYMQDYTNAKNYAVETIQAATRASMFQLINSAYIQSYSLDHVFEPEVLFALYNTQRGDLFDSYFSESNDARTMLATAENRVTNMYENTTDWRVDRFWDNAENSQANIFIKYEDQTPSTLLGDQWDRVRYMIPLIRLSELYLIVAECVGLQELNVTEAVESYLNPLRQARNEMPIEGEISTAQLREYIMNEYIRDFVGEGQTFFYFKRNELSSIPNGETAGATIPMDASRYVVPLPDSETDQRE